MKYRVEVEREGNLVKAETIKDKHPTKAIKQVLNDLEDDEVSVADRDIQVNVVNESGSFWIYKTKFKQKTAKWVGKLIKSFKNFFSTREVRLIFNDNRGIVSVAHDKVESAQEEFEEGLEDATDAVTGDQEENEPDKNKY
jgi:hypothetical protein